MDNHYELKNNPTFISELQDCAKLLIDKLENDSFQDASTLICNMIEARDKHIFSSVGKLTRGLHDAIVNFHVDGDLSSEPPNIESSEIHDATDRLNYVINLTQQAADKTMDMVEASAPIAMNLGQEANSLRDDWLRLRRREMSKEEFAGLYQRMDEFLQQMCDGTTQLNENMQSIVLEQGFQDLTGQVLKRVITLVHDVENELVKLVRVASQVEQVTGLVTKEVQGDEVRAIDNKGEGPQIHAEKRDDVVKGQDEVDDLLSSLGF
ncbi:protein phosphatase CheZ [Aurantivibrio plasticivorans]